MLDIDLSNEVSPMIAPTYCLDREFPGLITEKGNSYKLSGLFELRSRMRIWGGQDG